MTNRLVLGGLVEVGVTSWFAVYGDGTNTTDDYFSGIVLNSANELVVCGKQIGSSTPYSTGIVAKISIANANVLAQAVRNATRLAYFQNVKLDSAGNVYNFGFLQNSSGTPGSFVAVYNSTLTTLNWNKWFSYTSGDATAYGTLDSAGNSYYISANSANKFFMLKKLTSTGTVSFNVTITTTLGNLEVLGNTVSSTGDIYFAVNRSNSATTNSLGIFKYNSSGVRQAYTDYVGAANTYMQGSGGITSDASGNIYVSCHKYQGSLSLCILKINSTMGIVWQRTINITTTGSNITLGVDGFLYITCGNSIFKYDTDGTLQFQRTISGMVLKNVTADLTSMYICGQRTTNLDMFLARLPNDGSRTGTYTIVSGNVSIIYSVATYTESAGILTSTANPTGYTFSTTDSQPLYTASGLTSSGGAGLSKTAVIF